MLVLAALVAAGFFWMTDPALGPESPASVDNSVGIIDQVNHTRIGSYIGFAGSLSLTAIGFWLMLRPSA